MKPFPILEVMLVAVQAQAQAAPGNRQDISFTAAVDGSTQRYLEIRPPNFTATKPHHVLIALHGHGSDRHQAATDPRGEFAAARDVAAQRDLIYIAPDYRAPTSWMGPKAEADLVQIITDLRRKYNVGKVFLSGASMGGSAVLTFTALHPQPVAGVCSQNGTANHVEYQNFQDAIAASFGGTKQQLPAEYQKRSAELHPAAFTMPVAICAGGQDATVPAASVVRLAATLKKLNRPVLLIYRETGGHSTSYDDTRAS